MWSLKCIFFYLHFRCYRWALQFLQFWRSCRCCHSLCRFVRCSCSVLSFCLYDAISKCWPVILASAFGWAYQLTTCKSTAHDIIAWNKGLYRFDPSADISFSQFIVTHRQWLWIGIAKVSNLKFIFFIFSIHGLVDIRTYMAIVWVRPIEK